MSTPQIYGQSLSLYFRDACETLTQWEILQNTNPTSTLFQIYNGDYVSAPTCLRLWSTPGGSGGDPQFRLRQTILQSVPPQGGLYSYYFGFWLKFKNYGYPGPGAVYFYTTADDGTVISGVGFVAGGVQGRLRTVYGVTPSDIYLGTQIGPVVPLNEWHHIEVLSTAQGEIIFLDGVPVVQDTNTRVNKPPLYIVVYDQNLHIPYINPGVSPQEYYLDDITISDTLLKSVTLIVDSTIGGSVQPPVGAHVYTGGEIATITATADQSYYFHRFLINGRPVYGNPISFVILEDTHVYAEFINESVPPPIRRQLTISAHGNGTTNPAPGTHLYDEGDSISIYAEAASGYFFLTWTVDGVEAGSINPIILTMSRDIALDAYFATQGYQPSVTIRVLGSGSTDPAVGTYPVDPGTPVAVTATPDEGWLFNKWVIQGVDTGSENPITKTIYFDTSIIAEFVQEGGWGGFPWLLASLGGLLILLTARGDKKQKKGKKK